MIHLGGDYGGPEIRPSWKGSTNRKFKREAYAIFESGIFADSDWTLQLVYCFPGNLLKFEGQHYVDLDGINRKKKIITIPVRVQENLADEKALLSFLVNALSDSLRFAEQVNEEKELGADLTRHREAIREVRQAFAGQI